MRIRDFRYLFDLPIEASWLRPVRLIASAQREQIGRRRMTAHNQVMQDVRTAHARYGKARAELDQLRGKTRPEVEMSI